MRRLWFALLAVTACYRPEATACRVSCASSGECPNGLVCGEIDGLCHAPGVACAASPDAPPSTCYGTAAPPMVQICDPPIEAPLVFADGRVIETDGTACSFTKSQAGGPELCVIAAPSIVVGLGTVRAIGTRPLLLLGTERVQVEGRLDVASHVDASEPLSAPAGANDLACAISISGGSVGEAGGGGGAGGSFRALGGQGGQGGADVNLGGAGGAPASQIAEPMVVRGGCPGGPGGSSDAMPGGKGGSAGGAVYLMSGGTLAISGSINASGAGGGAANPASGGGGGGSGGMIVLDAPTLVVASTARLFALGGSGAAGGRSDGMAAASGNDPLGPGLRAPGPPGAMNGGKGGDGSAPINPQSGGSGLAGDGPGGGSAGGGGGGGGAGGFIRVVPAQRIGLPQADPATN